MKKKVTAIVLVVVVLAMLFTGMTLAYFTDEKEAENVFTFGDVDIDLIEEDWNPDDPTDPDDDPTIMEDVFPGMSFDKKPYISNKKENSSDAYVRMGVEIEKDILLALVGKTGEDVTVAMLEEVLDGEYGDGWTFARIDTTKDGTVIFWYNYGILPAGGTTSALFTGVTIPAGYTGKDIDTVMEDRTFGINVIAQAIQTVGFNSAEEAYAALDAEYGH